MSVESHQPAALDLDLSRQVLRITWADNVTTEYPGAFLRKHCPCAGCRTDRETRGRSLLPILGAAPKGEIRIVGGHLVGNYALQLDWSDGHNTGIFDFKLLRALVSELSPDLL